MNSSVICDVNEIYKISCVASYSYLYSRLYLYLLPLCNGTLFTQALGGMIHPVICDGGEIRPTEEVADVDCILHSHLYLYLHFFMYLYLKLDRDL